MYEDDLSGRERRIRALELRVADMELVLIDLLDLLREAECLSDVHGAADAVWAQVLGIDA
jgi:hypothetical protein